MTITLFGQVLPVLEQVRMSPRGEKEYRCWVELSNGELDVVESTYGRAVAELEDLVRTFNENKRAKKSRA